jgi:branched-chain amino acid transport system ATP-binding protein
MTALLSLKGVVAGYGQAMVLHGVDLDVRAGTVTCLIGPNGAGKSTVLNTVSGLLSPREGSITLGGRPLHGLSVRAVLELGVVHVPQERSLFPLMTVWENMLMGAYLIKDRGTVQRRVDQVAELYPLVGQRRHDRAGSLSGGEQRIVELARALLLDPLLVLMDEPSIGLAPQASRQVFDGIAAMRQAGRTVLLVEQNARSGLAVADHGVVLEAGVVRHEGTGAQLLVDPEVARLYLGAAAASGLRLATRSRTAADPRGDS